MDTIPDFFFFSFLLKSNSIFLESEYVTPQKVSLTWKK